MRGSRLESLGTGTPSQGLSTAAHHNYDSLGGLHTGTMFFHVSRLSASSSLRLNLVMFYSCWGLSGDVFTLRAINACLMIYIFPAWYS